MSDQIPNTDLKAPMRAAFGGFSASRGDVDAVMPFDALASREDDGTGHGDLEADATYEIAQRKAGARVMFRYLLEEGDSPQKIMKRVYMLGVALGVPEFVKLTMQERAQVMGETKGAVSWRTAQLSGHFERLGGMFRLPGQKLKSAGKNYSPAQKGNTNRRKGKRLNKAN